jgi:hypothetical protein
LARRRAGEKNSLAVGRAPETNLLPSTASVKLSLLFSRMPRQLSGPGPFCFVRHGFAGDRSLGARGNGQMRRFNSMLRSTRIRVGHAVSQFVTIAAASLPCAGA